MVDQMSELPTDGVEPLTHPIPLTNVLADDVVRPSLDRKDVLANAPSADDECFRVPPVFFKG